MAVGYNSGNGDRARLKLPKAAGRREGGSRKPPDKKHQAACPVVLRNVVMVMGGGGVGRAGLAHDSLQAGASLAGTAVKFSSSLSRA